MGSFMLVIIFIILLFIVFQFTPQKKEERYQRKKQIRQKSEKNFKDNQKISGKKDLKYRETVEVVGTQYTNAKKILRNVVKDNGGTWNAGDYNNHKLILTLKPEPNNNYDSNAIAVFSEYETPLNAKIERSGKLGYIPAEAAEIIKLKSPINVNATVKEGFDNFYIKINLSQLYK